MSSRHWLVHVPENPHADGDWQWCDASGTVPVAGRGNLEQCAASIRAGARMPVIALLPVSRVLSVAVDVPQRQQRQLLAALPFLLEETLAADIERFHVVAGRRVDAQRLQAVAIEREWLQATLQTLQGAGIEPDVITVDAFALPTPGCLFITETQALLRAPDESAAGCHPRDAGLLLAALSWPAGHPLRLVHAGEQAEAFARALESGFVADEASLSVQVENVPEGLMVLLARLAPEDWVRIPNLRQGTFAVRAGNDFSLGFDWRPLAWLAACWAIVALGYQLAVGVSYSRAAEATQVAQVELYKQLFPGSSNVPKPRQQMAGQIGSGAPRDGLFVSLVARTSEAFNELGGSSSGYKPGSLAWDGSQQQLRLDVLARSLEDLDRLRVALEQKGLHVDIGAGIAQDGGYKARINVGEGA